MEINEKDVLVNAQDGAETEVTETTEIREGEKGYYHPSTKINCALDVELDPKNVAIYVCKSSTQCFKFKALKCCGSADIKIEPDYGEGWYYNPYKNEWKKVVHDFGTFIFGNGGLCFKPDEDLEPGDSKTLTFKAKSCGNEVEFDATFVFDPCKCCCAGKSCKSCCRK